MQEEKYGSRDRAYSAWHRRFSIRRYVGFERAQLLAMVDLDAAVYCEYDDHSKEPLALIETAVDVGQRFKPATVTTALAQRAGLPCYAVLYRHSDEPNPADGEWADITMFRVKRLWPDPERMWRSLTPQEWADALLRIRAWRARQLDLEAKPPKAEVRFLKKAAAKVRKYPKRQRTLEFA